MLVNVISYITHQSVCEDLRGTWRLIGKEGGSTLNSPSPQFQWYRLEVVELRQEVEIGPLTLSREREGQEMKMMPLQSKLLIFLPLIFYAESMLEPLLCTLLKVEPEQCPLYSCTLPQLCHCPVCYTCGKIAFGGVVF